MIIESNVKLFNDYKFKYGIFKIMSKPIQNVLARNSKGKIAYLCSKCGKEVKKEATICENCGARLGKIRCPFCNYVGGIDDFKMDTCPRCGRKSNQNIASTKNTKKNIRNYIGLSTKLFWFLFIILTASIFFLIIIMLHYFEFI